MSNSHGKIPAENYKRLFTNLQPCNPERLNNNILANIMRDDGVRIPAGLGTLYAGLTYLGQFIDHDLTLEDLTNLNTPGIVDIDTLINKRTSWFDLDCVYGKSNQFLNAQGLFDIAVNSVGEEDLTRGPDGRAIIADKRNEENLLVGRIQLAFLKFHNKVFTDLQLQNPTWFLPQLITQSKRIVQWHYQHIVINDFLADLCGKYFARLFDTQGNPIIHPAIKDLGASLPIEFTGAVYRFGHSMVRNGYYLNQDFDLFPLFDPVLHDLTGFKPLPPFEALDWSMFFPMPYSKGFQEMEAINPFIVSSLFDLPQVVAAGLPSLAQRNLDRGCLYGLPSGQDLARAMGIDENEILAHSKGNLNFVTINPAITPDQIQILTQQFGEQTPLWFYILMEAYVFTNGVSLGPLGSSIVGGVFLSLMYLNQESGVNNAFTPTLGQFGCIETGSYYMSELLTFAFDLSPFDTSSQLPDIDTNFFDQHVNKQFNIIQGRTHPRQPTVQPGLIPEDAVQAYPGMVVNRYDPTLILGTATQVEVNQVAQNALNAGLNSVYAVFKFIGNKNIQAIANGLITSLSKPIPLPVILHPSKPIDYTREPIQITSSQLRGRALTETINNSLTTTIIEAQAILLQVEQEISNTLSGINISIVDVNYFLRQDILIN
jgi:hypothetical protein